MTKRKRAASVEPDLTPEPALDDEDVEGALIGNTELTADIRWCLQNEWELLQQQDLVDAMRGYLSHGKPLTWLLEQIPSEAKLIHQNISIFQQYSGQACVFAIGLCPLFDESPNLLNANVDDLGWTSKHLLCIQEIAGMPVIVLDLRKICRRANPAKGKLATTSCRGYQHDTSELRKAVLATLLELEVASKSFGITVHGVFTYSKSWSTGWEFLHSIAPAYAKVPYGHLEEHLGHLYSKRCAGKKSMKATHTAYIDLSKALALALNQPHLTPPTIYGAYRAFLMKHTQHDLPEAHEFVEQPTDGLTAFDLDYSAWARTQIFASKSARKAYSG